MNKNDDFAGEGDASTADESRPPWDRQPAIDPWVPAYVTLRHFRYAFINAQMVRDSGLARDHRNLGCALLLWCAAWLQHPAGSLPNDEAQLAGFAGFGNDRRGWLRRRDGAMRGWRRGADGRLYHPVLSMAVADAWNGSRQSRGRKITADWLPDGSRAAADRQPSGDQAAADRQDENEEDQRPTYPTDSPSTRARQDRTGQEESVDPSGSTGDDASPIVPDLPADPEAVMKEQVFNRYRERFQAVTNMDEKLARSLIGKWVRDHGVEATHDAFQAMFRERPVGNLVEWMVKALQWRKANGKRATAENPDLGRDDDKAAILRAFGREPAGGAVDAERLDGGDGIIIDNDG